MDEYRGAYGFRLLYPDWGLAREDLVELDPSAPAVTIDWRLASTVRTHEHVGENRVSMGAKDASSFHVEREPARITFDLEFPPSPDALVHPLVTVPIAVLARWRGDVTLHGGAFATSSGAWAVAGVREAGKSTMLAILADRGYPVVADDLVAILGGDVLAGPQCVDLRADVAARFENVRSLGFVGRRERFRLSAPRAPRRAPLRGMFLLDWRDSKGVTIEPIPPAERLQWFYRLEYMALLGSPDPRKLLDLAALPAWRLTRSRDWAATEAAAEELLAVATGELASPNRAS